MGQVLFVLSNIFAATVAYVAADLTMKDREPWRRALATIAGFPIVVLVVILSLGNVGHLSAGSTVLMVGVMASAAIGIRRCAANRPRINTTGGRINSAHFADAAYGSCYLSARMDWRA